MLHAQRRHQGQRREPAQLGEAPRDGVALRLVRTSGTLPADAVDAVRAAGLDDRQIVEAIGAVSAILFTNMLNRANDTTLDFPGVDTAV
jgi:alkylhydroperoxidase family enzyme